MHPIKDKLFHCHSDILEVLKFYSFTIEGNGNTAKQRENLFYKHHILVVIQMWEAANRKRLIKAYQLKKNYWQTSF